jgi:hypothetical protein
LHLHAYIKPPAAQKTDFNINVCPSFAINLVDL